MIENNISAIYREYGAPKSPFVKAFNSYKDLIDDVLNERCYIGKVLFKPWAYMTEYSRPATLLDDTESRILKDEYAKYRTDYHFDPNLKSDSDKLVDDLYGGFENNISKLQERADNEFPECQLDVGEYIFLSDFSWVEAELNFYNEVILQQRSAGKEKKLFDLFDVILNERIFLITFLDSVYYSSYRGA